MKYLPPKVEAKMELRPNSYAFQDGKGHLNLKLLSLLQLARSLAKEIDGSRGSTTATSQNEITPGTGKMNDKAYHLAH